ncbi:hypothetical protein Tco_1128953 [Tanacetum coccineum]
MAVLESCPKHNMVAYLEKTEGNAEFHKIIDFLTRSSIHHALTVSLVVSTTFVEQFWTSAKSKIINNVRHITAKVAGKHVSISEASIRKSSGGNLGGHSFSDKSLSGNEGEMTLQSVYDLFLSLCAQVSDQAKEIQHLKAQIKKLKKQAKPGRKFAKGEPSVHKDPLFDEIPKDTLDYMETEDAQDVGRTRDVVDEEKENDEDVLSTDKKKVSTDRPIVSTDGSKVNTDRQKDSIDEQNEGTDDQNEGTDDQIKGTDEQSKGTDDQIEGTDEQSKDDETIAQVLLNMSQAKVVSREKEKGVEFKDIEETDRPRPTSTRPLLTLKHLPKIDPKDKGKKKIKEEDESKSESDGIPEAEKKFKQLASDEEMSRKVQEEWEREEERKILVEEEAT